MEEKTGLDISLGLMKIWKLNYESCLKHAFDSNDQEDNHDDNDNLDNDELFINEDIKYDDTKDLNDKKELLQILSTIKFFSLTTYSMNGGDPKNNHDKDDLHITECAKFLCRINILDLIKDRKFNIYNNNKYIYIEFIIDANSTLESYDICFLKSRTKNIKLTNCVFAQFPNHIYNQLFVYIQESDLIYIIIDYLPKQDCIKQTSQKKLTRNIKKQTITRKQMLQYDLITIHKELIIQNDIEFKSKTKDEYNDNNDTDEPNKYIIDYKNNRKFICNSYGNINENKLMIILRSISFISKYWNPPDDKNHKTDNSSNNGWRTLEEKDFKNGHSIDVRYTDEHNETFWTIGTICNVQSNRLLIHIPRFGAVWRNKTSNDIAPTGLHTEGFA